MKNLIVDYLPFEVKPEHITESMKENKELPNENNETQIYYPFYGNIMSCQNFFDTEGLMTNYR